MKWISIIVAVLIFAIHHPAYSQGLGAQDYDTGLGDDDYDTGLGASDYDTGLGAEGYDTGLGGEEDDAGTGVEEFPSSVEEPLPDDRYYQKLGDDPIDQSEPQSKSYDDLPTYQSPRQGPALTNQYDYTPQGPQQVQPPGVSSFDNDRLFSGQTKATSPDQQFYYDHRGQQVGRSEVDGNVRRFYNNSGQYTGYVEQDANRTQYYNKSGATSGYSVQEGNITRHYSQQGEYIGYSIDQGNIILQYDNKTGYKPRTIDLDR